MKTILFALFLIFSLSSFAKKTCDTEHYNFIYKDKACSALWAGLEKDFFSEEEEVNRHFSEDDDFGKFVHFTSKNKSLSIYYHRSSNDAVFDRDEFYVCQLTRCDFSTKSL